MLNKIRSLKKKNNAEHKKVQTVFTRDFIIGIMNGITKKNIKSFITSEAHHVFGTDDFYFGYIFDNGCLKYVAHKSTSHDEGKVSKLSAVLINEGNYYIHDHDNYFIFKNIGTEIKQLIDYDEYSDDSEKESTQNLENVEFSDVPKTLLLQWSLNKRVVYTNAILIAIFMVQLAANVTYGQKFSEVTKKAETMKRQIMEKASQSETVKLQDISQPIRKLESLLDGRGMITVIKGQKNDIGFAIKFKNENDARTFIQTNGGSYENGKVVLSASYSNPK